jgi:hypothetical protein
VRRGLLAGVAFVAAGLALEAGRRRDRQAWLRIRERLANLRRLMTADYLAMQEFRARVFPGYCPVESVEVDSEGARPRLEAWELRHDAETAAVLAAEERRVLALFGCPPGVPAEVNLENGYFCPAAEKYAAKG